MKIIPVIREPQRLMANESRVSHYKLERAVAVHSNSKLYNYGENEYISILSRTIKDKF